ncbi:MAG: insulinase family protein [Bacteroidia bacterium]|nr:insulinase family protein [Bacteroidia bacterium]
MKNLCLYVLCVAGFGLMFCPEANAQTEPGRVVRSTENVQIKSSNPSFPSPPTNNLLVEKYTLPNGLTVYLNEDHNLPSVYGGVAVNAGGKYDPADNTGMGHYLEHMLFKGTETMGTVDFQKEKPYLERINRLYDSLGMTKDEEQRKKIQLLINETGVKAAEYAVPNDMDRLLKSFGSTGVNAFTAFELIFYHNTFPANEMQKWLTIYSDRFENPVFRLFQSELEVVYEEKNRGQDNMGTAIFETFLTSFFKKHPYGQSIIGKTEHLKNPSLNKMYEYYHTYYVPNNMALVLCGDFDSREVKPLIEKLFGDWKRKELPVFNAPKEAPFKGAEVINARLTPVKVGVAGYRSVPNGHPDQYGMEVVSHLLSNGNQTGLLDRLTTERKLMVAQTFPLQLNDEGAYIVIMVPKIVGQSLKKAESLIQGEMNKIKKGEFTQAQLNAAKQQLKMQFYRNLEDNESRGVQIANLFTQKTEWETYLNYPQMIDRLTKEDVIRIANQYLGENYLKLNSKMGFPKKDKLTKPEFKPVIPKDGLHSEYSVGFQKIPSGKILSPFIDIKKDVSLTTNIGEGLYYVKNPVNDIASLTVKYKTGFLKNRYLSKVAEYMNLTGSESIPFLNFKTRLDSLGCSVNFEAGEDYFEAEIEGLEGNFPVAVALFGKMMNSPEINDSKIKNLVNNAQFEPRLFKREKEQIGIALRDYAMYGDKSVYLNRLTLKEIKALTASGLVSEWEKVKQEKPEFHYVGKMPEKEVAKLIQENISVSGNSSQEEVKPLKPCTENTVLLLDDKKARQSHIWFYIPGNDYNINDEYQMDAFNSYFGGDMSALMFQEIREFRSLAYATRGNYTKPPKSSQKGYFAGYIGCQGDKTMEAIQTLQEMLVNLPQKPDRIEAIRSGLIAKIPSNKPEFRSLIPVVRRWQEFGYKEDPSVAKSHAYPKLTFQDIVQFYNNNLKGKPMVITIVGDKSKFDLDMLQKFGKIRNVELKEIYRH